MSPTTFHIYIVPIVSLVGRGSRVLSALRSYSFLLSQSAVTFDLDDWLSFDSFGRKLLLGLHVRKESCVPVFEMVEMRSRR